MFAIIQGKTEDSVVPINMVEGARNGLILGVFTNLLNVGCERGEVTEDPYIFGLNSQEDGVQYWGNQVFSCKHAKSEMPNQVFK